MFRFQFHVMRDHPDHNYPIIAGLWGADNYANLSRALALKSRLFSTEPWDWKYSDQTYLRDTVWPQVAPSIYLVLKQIKINLPHNAPCLQARHSAFIHDSHRCGLKQRRKYG